MARGGRPVLRDISIDVAPGEITALLGANGAGKSTLVLTMAGILPALRGHVCCDGTELVGTIAGLRAPAGRRLGA